jgi:hypothetical protein
LSRRSRRWYWTSVAALAVVAVAGATVAVLSILDVRRPDSVVRQYFADLRAGRAAEALALGPVPDGDRRFLTPAVLGLQATAGRIEDLRIGAVARHGDRATVTVSYRLSSAGPEPARGGSPSTVSDTVPVHRDGLGWALDASAVIVGPLYASARDRIALAGIAIPTAPVLMFPGSLPASTNSAELAIDRGAAVVRFDGAAPRLTPLLTSAGESAVLAAIDAALQACLEPADASSTAPTGGRADCPLDVPDQRYVPQSMTGTVSSPPSAGATSIDVATDPAGSVAVQGGFSVDAAWQQLDFDNIAQPESGSLTLTFAASVALVEPLVVTWTPASA